MFFNKLQGSAQGGFFWFDCLFVFLITVAQQRS